MEEASRPATGGRHATTAGVSDGAARGRWRIAERVLSIAIGGAALSGAVYLGVTGPLLSPVDVQAAAPAGDGAAATGTPGVGGGTVDDGRDGAHRPGNGHHG